MRRNYYFYVYLFLSKTPRKWPLSISNTWFNTASLTRTTGEKVTCVTEVLAISHERARAPLHDGVKGDMHVEMNHNLCVLC